MRLCVPLLFALLATPGLAQPHASTSSCLRGGTHLGLPSAIPTLPRAERDRPARPAASSDVDCGQLRALATATPSFLRWRAQSWVGGRWELTDRGFEVFDERGLVVETVWQARTSAGWSDRARSLFAYDERGRQVEHERQQPTQGGWSPSGRTLYTYEDADLVRVLSQRWRGSGWENQTRSLSTYDPEGREIERVSQVWTGADWANNYRELNAYNEAGARIESVGQRWTEMGWVNKGRTLTTSATGRLVTQAVSHTWADSAWVNVRRSTYDYDERGQQAQGVWEAWDEGRWVLDSRSHYAYHANGDWTEWRSSVWTGARWENSALSTFDYDGDGLRTKVLRQTWDGEAWVKVSRELYDYAVSTAAEETPPGDPGALTVYPNPLRNRVALAWTMGTAEPVGFEVLDLVGRRVAVLPRRLRAPGPHEVRWDLSGLAAGTYVLRPVGLDGVPAQRLVVVP